MKTKSRHDNNKFEFLDEEVKVEIFRQLPVKTLVLCTCVCKSWNLLIKDSAFICDLLRNRRNDGPLALFFRHYLNYEPRVTQSDTHYVYPDFQIRRIQDFPLAHDRRHFTVTDSINGLVCVVGDNYSTKVVSRPQTLVLWNPSIRKYIILPNPNLFPKKRCFVGFGYDSRCDDYKLLRMINLPDPADFKSVAEVFSLNSGSWKIMDSSRVPHCKISSVPGTQAIVNGIIHWNALRQDKSNVLLGFNARDETFQEIEIPQDLASRSIDPMLLNVLVYNDSTIGIFCKERHNNYKHCRLWIMKDYGESSSWIKVFTMGEEGRHLHPVGIGVTMPIGCVGQELFYRKSEYPTGIIGINLVNGEVRYHDFLLGERFTFITTYVESLVLLNR
ncbi:putative F-box protein At3g16210 [Mercurialis annua]|uniref:putative F-box protein At3g16210 n=1 Tax=Mercurialis annua TaxID=3986 RepID=UPI0021605A56|nr:putative F-box protein At3g16210 [Mercurialis annua]